YRAEHGAEIMALRKEKYGETIKIEPIKIEQPILVQPEAAPVKLDIKPIEPPAVKKQTVLNKVAAKVKDAAQKTGETIAEVGHRIGEKARAVRQEIRARAKERCEKKTQARLERKRQREENLQARTSNRLMKTLLRHAPAQDYMAEGTSNTQKVQRSPISAAVLRDRMAGRG
ncbi:MAG: hypothetical protein IJ846_00840, partial [Alphaproteobacteria bacterium]|nr:hypothetical protein [Alphaproteobacteria bacterium]